MERKIETLQELADAFRQASANGEKLAFVMWSDGSGAVVDSASVDYKPSRKALAAIDFHPVRSKNPTLIFEDGEVAPPPKLGFKFNKGN